MTPIALAAPIVESGCRLETKGSIVLWKILDASHSLEIHGDMRGSLFSCLENLIRRATFFRPSDGTTQTFSVGMSDNYGTRLPSPQLTRRDTGCVFVPLDGDTQTIMYRPCFSNSL